MKSEPGPSVPAAPAPGEGEPSPPPPRRRGARVRRALLQSTLGLALGLGLAEGGFRHRDGGAFPLVNVYEADGARGVRLAPGSSTVVGRRGERRTHVRVNHDGYRGAEWPSPAPFDVLVIGDSMSFGLGVEEEEALPARLRAALPGSVIDASVPTYGPPEYLLTMAEVLEKRRPRAVVVVVNLANDLSEIDRPNAARHTAVDGYAARLGGGAPRASSPLRAAIIQRSHAAFALWRWDREGQSANSPPPEGPGLEALLAVAMREAASKHAEDEHRAAEERRAAARLAAENEHEEARRAIVGLARRHRGLIYGGLMGRAWDSYLRGDGRPGDEIFPDYYGGCGPPPRFYREQEIEYPRKVRYSSARIQREVESLLLDLSRGLAPEPRREIEAAFRRRARALESLRSSPAEPPPPPPAREPLPLAPFVAQAAALAQAHGAELVLVAAPLDAAVSPAARAKRGLTELEAAALSVLTEEIANLARASGAIGVDATPALRTAGDAAYLADGHLSPSGHQVVARAVAEALASRG